MTKANTNISSIVDRSGVSVATCVDLQCAIETLQQYSALHSEDRLLQLVSDQCNAVLLRVLSEVFPRP